MGESTIGLTKIAAKSICRSWTLSPLRRFYKTSLGDCDRILAFKFKACVPEVGEVMVIVQVTITAEPSYTIIRDAIMTFPTTAERLVALFRTVSARDSSLFPRLR